MHRVVRKLKTYHILGGDYHWILKRHDKTSPKRRQRKMEKEKESQSKEERKW